jgi:hypothetical protein
MLPYAVTPVALTDEQRAMVQLLLEGGQGYDDISSLLGITPDEVRSRARAALTEIGGADPDAQVALSDYLLGQADPIGRADAIRHLQSDPEANALAERLVQNLRLLAPKAQLPDIPEPRGGRRAPAPPPSPDPAAPVPPAAPSAPAPPQPAQPQGPGFASRVSGFFSRFSRMSGKRRTQFLVAMAAVLGLVIVVVAVASGGGGGKGDCSPLASSQAQQAAIAKVDLSAIGPVAQKDCAPTGVVSVIPIPAQQGKKGQSQQGGFALQTEGAHLDPASNGDLYLLWLYKSDSEAAPLGQLTVNDTGNLTGAAALPLQGVLYLQQFPSIRVSKVTQSDAQQLTQAIQARGSKATSAPFAGTPVLEGSGTDLLQQLVQAAQAQTQAQGGTGTTQQGGGKAGAKQ